MIQGDGYVIVESGDYLGTIANRVGVSVPKLQEMNGISNPDFIHVGQKIKTKEETKEKPQAEVKEEPKQTTKEKVNKQREQTKDEDVKTSKETQCCPVIAPWKVLEFDEKGKQRSYELEVAEEVITNDGEKVSREVVSKGQQVSEHNLYMVAPPVDNDGNPQTKEIEVGFTFIKNPCNYTMFVKNKTLSKKKEIETGEEGVAKKAKFTIDTEGHIEGTYDYFDIGFCVPRKHIPNIQYVDGNENTTAGAMTDLNEISYMEVEEVPKRNFILMLIKQITGKDYSTKEMEILPVGGKECTLQPKVKLFVTPYHMLDGSIEITFGKKHSLDETETKHIKDKLTGVITVDGKKKTPNKDFAKINRGFVSSKTKIKYTIASFTRSHEWVLTRYNPISTGIEAKNPTNPVNPKYEAEKTKIVKLKHAREMFSGFQQVINGFYQVLDDGSKGTVQYGLGSTSLKFHAKKWQYQEDKATNLCGYVGEINLGITLLNNIYVKLDLVAMLIAGKGPVTTWLTDLRTKIAKGIKSGNYSASAELSAFLGIEGGIDGKLIYGRKEVSEPLKVSGEIEGKVSLILNAKAEVKAQVLRVEGAAGAEFLAASTKSKFIKPSIIGKLSGYVDDKGELQTKGTVELNGFTIYYMVYFHIVINSTVRTKKQKPLANMKL